MKKVDYGVLFEKVKIGPLVLKNRFVMAPMSVHMSHDGSVTPEEIAFYERRARGGAAMLIVGSVCIIPVGKPALTSQGINPLHPLILSLKSIRFSKPSILPPEN
ncbi:hypothetical protein FCN80_07145 [Martelella alba]|uniref:NADH:flavin oxidoreductase/NADH oxidase N-terminal domain-containing protein n=1 Tax=Martelella alba TaxID=2590451 RepID=A0ABY2SMV8_9HYPH|nr:hypothetical protein FCN80_07145 [Martelella alba]